MEDDDLFDLVNDQPQAKAGLNNHPPLSYQVQSKKVSQVTQNHFSKGKESLMKKPNGHPFDFLTQSWLDYFSDDVPSFDVIFFHLFS